MHGLKSFLQFWHSAPLQSPAFWRAFWKALWARNSRMEFLSYTFWVFLAVCAAVGYVCPKKLKPVWLLLCSCTFFMVERPGARLAVWPAAVITVTYLCGLLLGRSRRKGLRRALLGASVCVCLGALLYGRYGAPAAGLPTLLGASYFTLQACGYVIDVYRGDVAPERNAVNYALYVWFFPCLIAGPLERASHFLPQLHTPRPFVYDRVAGGAFRMLWGAFKKLVIAGNLELFTRAVFTGLTGYSGSVLALAAAAFVCQLYMDFSGCCDVALGAGQVLGFTLTENFDHPFRACRLDGFWQRWHCSLTDWLRRYVYFPLGGSRCPAWRAALNTFVVFAVSGLWHGANTGYLVWGLLNGALLLAGRATAAWRGALRRYSPLRRLPRLSRLLQQCLVFAQFSLSLVFFAAGYHGGTAADGWYLLCHLFCPAGQTLAALWAPLRLRRLALLTGGGVLFVTLLERFGRPHQVIRRLCFPLRWALYYALLLAILLAGNLGASGFVYGTF